MIKIPRKEDVVVYLIHFRGDTNRVYATSSKGELLYERHITNASNGYVDITKEGEIVRMDFKNGSRSISARTTGEEHGGTGFCQRENGEKFSDCFKAEADEFCDSFISCIALATRPKVSILLAIACSCNATK